MIDKPLVVWEEKEKLREVEGMSRVRPILFNTDMVQVILDGRKTVTRRVAKKIPVETHRIEVNLCPETFKGIEVKEFECHWGGYQPDTGNFVDGMCIVKPPCQPGDILYVRETWNVLPYSGEYLYKADCDLKDKFLSSLKWRPSIHMPKEAARIWLKVTDVRVEQLHEITDEQAAKEGFDGGRCSCGGNAYACTDCYNSGWIEPPWVGFMHTWNSTIKKVDFDRYGWDANPWVWVIEFEQCGKPEEWLIRI